MNKKIKYLIILAFFIIIIIIALYFFINNKKDIFVNENDVEKDTDEKLLNLSDNEIYNLATEENNENYCSKIKDIYSQDVCYKLVAISKLDSEICNKIDDENIRLNCKNISLSKAVEKNGNIEICGQITEKKSQKKCINDNFNYKTTINDCQKIIDYSSSDTTNGWKDFEINKYCNNIVLFREAVADNNIAKCKEIFYSDLKAGCLSRLYNISLTSDNDNDGLNFRDEIIYQTDPDNPDSDDDGFLDGEEIKNKYDPKGEG